jgi:hypothetical protein
MELNTMSVPELEKLLGSMKQNFKLENKGCVRLLADAAVRAPAPRKAANVTVKPRNSSTYASMVMR